MLLALDTETTGLDIKHGCRPFIVSIAFDTNKLMLWEWAVDPLTRTPLILVDDIDEIQQILTDPSVDEIVMHNSKFDIEGLTSIRIDFAGLGLWSKVQDTLCGAHILDSIEPHGLKELALKYLGIPDDDKAELKTAINRCRAIGRKYQWRIAAPFDPHFPSQKRAPRIVGWQVMDMWLPAVVAARFPDIDKAHPEYRTVCRKYALRDAERTLGLRLLQKPVIDADPDYTEHYLDHLKLLPAVYRMEQRGISVRYKVLQSEKHRYDRVSVQLNQKALNALGANNGQSSKINTHSVVDMRKALYDDFHLPVIKQVKTGPSTDQATMVELLDQLTNTPSPSPTVHYQQQAIIFLQSIIESRKQGKMVEYLESYERSLIHHPSQTTPRLTGHYALHPSFLQTGTGTTRFSCERPNTTNVSKKDDRNIRVVFGPAPGRIWYAGDYMNIEMRILSYIAGIKGFTDIFDKNGSVHIAVAEALYGSEALEPGFTKTDKYRWTKNGNFAVPYGAGEEKADLTYNRPGAYQILCNRFDISNFSVLMREKISEAIRLGYITTAGYRLFVPREKPYAALNYFVQGMAGIICKRAMISCHDYLLTHCPNAFMVMMIHDEIVFDFPIRHRRSKHLPEIKRLMEQPGTDLGIATPVSIDVIPVSWDAGEEILL